MSNKTAKNKTAKNDTPSTPSAPIVPLALTEQEKRIARLNQEILAEKESLAAAKLENEKKMAAFIDTLPSVFSVADLKSVVAIVRKHMRKNGATVSTGAGRKNTVDTPENREKVKAMVEARQTGEEIAAALGISLPSVQKIKAALGLVKPHKVAA